MKENTHINAMKFVLAGESGKVVSLVGDSTGGGMIETKLVNSYPLRVKADHLLISNLSEDVVRTVKDLVLIQAPPFTDFRYGDRVRAEGKLQTPMGTGDFDYREYLARQGVYSIMSRPCVTARSVACDQGFAPLAWFAPFTGRAFKARAKLVLVRILPEPQASLLTGILLGDDSGIPKSVQDAFCAMGTSHIIAISRYNNTILV